MSVTLANAGAVDRSSTDFYPTPHEVTHALLDFIKLPTSTSIWEPAAGAGHMVSVMQSRGYEVSASDLYSYTNEDFLDIWELRGDWIITNPPFKQAEEFIRHAQDLEPAGFAMLLKSQYWHATKRLKLFQETKPTYILPLTWRPDFLFGSKSGSPTMEVLWTVWIRDNETPTQYIPLSKNRVEAQLLLLDKHANQ